MSSDDFPEKTLNDVIAPTEAKDASSPLAPTPQTLALEPTPPAKKTVSSKKNVPHYTGHRQRLRQRLLDNGPEALADYELLELLLMLAIPRKDVKPLAKDLITKFGDFASVIAASPEDLTSIPGIKDNTVAALKTVEGAAVLMLKGRVQEKPVLAAWDALMDYCLASQSRCEIEEFHVLYLDTKKHLLADETMQRGTINHLPVYIREVVKRALELKAHSVIMVHNHPSGDPSPSRADVDTTRQMQQALATVEIVLLDHIIVSPGRYISLRQEKLI